MAKRVTRRMLHKLKHRLREKGIKVTITCSLARALWATSKPIAMRAYLNRQRYNESSGVAYGGPKGERKILIYLRLRDLLRNEKIYTIMLHEAGHLLPWPTGDEVLAWDRAFILAETITDNMRKMRKEALATYNITEE